MATPKKSLVSMLAGPVNIHLPPGRTKAGRMLRAAVTATVMMAATTGAAIAGTAVVNEHVDRNAMATPESIQLMNTQMEQAIDSQFPEMAGRVVVLNREADPAVEWARAMKRLNTVNVSAVSIDSTEDEDSKAVMGYDAGGRPACLIQGLDLAAYPGIANIDYMYTLVYQAVGHCMNALNYDHIQVNSHKGLSEAVNNERDKIAKDVGLNWIAKLKGKIIDLSNINSIFKDSGIKSLPVQHKVALKNSAEVHGAQTPDMDSIFQRRVVEHGPSTP